MNLSGPKESSEGLVATPNEPFTTYLNLPLGLDTTSLLHASSTLLTPPASTDPGVFNRNWPHLCSPHSRSPTPIINSRGPHHPLTAEAPQTLGLTNANSIDFFQSPLFNSDYVGLLSSLIRHQQQQEAVKRLSTSPLPSSRSPWPSREFEDEGLSGSLRHLLSPSPSSDLRTQLFMASSTSPQHIHRPLLVSPAEGGTISTSVGTPTSFASAPLLPSPASSVGKRQQTYNPLNIPVVNSSGKANENIRPWSTPHKERSEAPTTTKSHGSSWTRFIEEATKPRWTTVRQESTKSKEQIVEVSEIFRNSKKVDANEDTIQKSDIMAHESLALLPKKKYKDAKTLLKNVVQGEEHTPKNSLPEGDSEAEHKKLPSISEAAPSEPISESIFPGRGGEDGEEESPINLAKKPEGAVQITRRPSTDSSRSSFGAEDGRIDVCTMKDSLLLKVVEPQSFSARVEMAESPDAVEDGSEEQDATSCPPQLFSQLGSQCSRTVPSLLKFYSRHKRSLSSSLSINLAVSGQVTPPCSPISPGTVSVVLPSTSQKFSLEVSTMTSPTDRASSTDQMSSRSSAGGGLERTTTIQEKRTLTDVDDDAITGQSPIAALTLLTAANVVPSLTPPKHHLTPSPSKLSPSGLVRPPVKKKDRPSEDLASVPHTRSLSLSPATTGITYPSPWTLNPNHITHPGPYWIPPSLPPGVDSAVGAAALGLGYHVARDQLTGQLFLLPRPHPLSDPSGHGLMWTGYGSMSPSPVLMTPQQLLLSDPHCRHLHHPPLLPIRHSHSLHSSPDSKGEEVLSSTHDPKMASTPQASPTSELTLPPSVPPHYMYPPTTLPYYFPPPQPPYGLPAFPSAGVPKGINHSHASISLASSAQTLTATPSDVEMSLSSTTTVSCFKSCSTPSSVWSSRADRPIPSPFLSRQSSDFPVDYPDPPPMDLTQRHNRSPFKEREVVEDSLCSVAKSSHIGLATSKPFSSKCLRIKKEIKEEVLSPPSALHMEEEPTKLFEKKITQSIKIEHYHNKSFRQNHLDNVAVVDPNLRERFRSLSLHSEEQPVTVSLTNHGEERRVVDTGASGKIDSSGLELLLHTFLQHGDRLAPSPVEEIDSDSSHSEQMPRLERATRTPSPRRYSSESLESLPPVLTPLVPVPIKFPKSAAEAPSSYTDGKAPSRLRPNEPSKRSLPSTPTDTEKQSCFSALCALAEQCILEEQNSCSALDSLADVALSTPGADAPRYESDSSLPESTDYSHDNKLSGTSEFPPKASTSFLRSRQICTPPKNIDINRNYKSPESERGVRAFIANKASQYHKDCHSSDMTTVPTYQIDDMDPAEIDMRMKLADIQRQYKEKQRELSRLVPKRDSSSQSRRGRGRPPKPKTCAGKKVSGIKRRNSLTLEDKEDNYSEEKYLSSSSVQDTSSDLWERVHSDDEAIRSISSNSCCRAPLLDGFEQNNSHNEAAIESSTSDAELQAVSSSSKKRKPGRPKKHSNTVSEATETIVAKNAKSLGFLMLSQKSKIRPKLKAELKIRDTDDEMERDEEDYDEEELSSNYNDVSEDETKESPLSKLQVSYSMNKPKFVNNIHHCGLGRGRTPVSRDTILRDKEIRKTSFEKNSQMQELFRSLKRHSKIADPEHDESGDEKEFERTKEDNYDLVVEETKPLTHGQMVPHPVPPSKPTSTVDGELTIDEEEKGKFDNKIHQPASPFKEPPLASVGGGLLKEAVASEEELKRTKDVNGNVDEKTPEEVKEKIFKEETPKEREESVCTLHMEDLVKGARVLVLQDGLLYAGSLTPITPPDVYSVHIDGERGTRPHICCQEQLLTQSWKEVKPGTTRFLTEGTRVCAFWSQQYRGLYPGCVAPVLSSLSHEANHNLVNVEFDDGDSGRIHVDDIRLLPTDFPVIEHDPYPLMTFNKRKSRPSGEESVSDVPSGVAELGKANMVMGLAGHEDEVVEGRRISSSPEKTHQKRKHSPSESHKKKKKKKKKTDKTLPHVERGDNELKMRIKSPPHVSEEESLNSGSEEDEAIAKTPTKKNKIEKWRNTSEKKPHRVQKRKSSEKSKIAPFLLKRRLWKWSGKGYKRPGTKGKGKKEFHKEIVRGKERIKVGDCAVFLSSGNPERPYIGKIDFLWEGWGGTMVVKVRWFYHPDETRGAGRKLSEPRGALFSSSHMDENDVQTISHKCDVISLAEYKVRRAEVDRKKGPDYENYDLYYLAGFYDTNLNKITMEPGVS